jgi:2-desacetyl-2-hydroxyethyl bacteriochlorophyllide A dehydrogenase
MRALQITQPYKFKIIDAPVPAYGEDEVLIRLEYAAICNQNDCKIFYRQYGKLFQYPCDPGVYGHEGCGIVIEKGESVNGIEIGDRIAMMLEGGPALYSEYVLRKADKVAKVDKKISPENAALIEIFGCAHHCVKIAGDISGKEIVVSGLGPAGLAIIQMLKLKNPGKIIALDFLHDRLKMARKFRAERLVDAKDISALNALKEEGADLVIDAAGTPESIQNAFDLTRKDVLIFGFTNERFEIDQSQWFQKEMTIKNSRTLNIDDLNTAAKLLEENKIDAAGLISGIMSFEEYDQAVEKIAKKQALKILLKWND